MNEFADWRARARTLLAAGVAPEHAQWDGARQRPVLAAPDPVASSGDAGSFRISQQLYEMLETAACHRDERRFYVMYRLLWRVTHGEPRLLDDAADDDVRVVARMVRAVRLDSHKMTAFVRFREVRDEGAAESTWIAWYEPSHHIVARTAPFFVKRFATMVWTIVTPDGIAHWDRSALALLPYDASIARPAHDGKEALWLLYYESIFNPARLNVRAMQKEMPQKYWANLPEATRIPELVAMASQRAGRMVETESAPRLPRTQAREPAPVAARAPGDAAPTKADIDGCRRCPLWERATQGVNGKGPPRAALMLVGEQPGDAEDLAGEPFVGPAGKLLRNALERDDEMRHVKPRVVVALGASALFALTGQKMAIAAARARPLQLAEGRRLVATYHPAAILRAPDDAARTALLQALVDDLRRAAALAPPIPGGVG